MGAEKTIAIGLRVLAAGVFIAPKLIKAWKQYRNNGLPTMEEFMSSNYDNSLDDDYPDGMYDRYNPPSIAPDEEEERWRECGGDPWFMEEKKNDYCEHVDPDSLPYDHPYWRRERDDNGDFTDEPFSMLTRGNFGAGVRVLKDDPEHKRQLLCSVIGATAVTKTNEQAIRSVVCPTSAFGILFTAIAQARGVGTILRLL